MTFVVMFQAVEKEEKSQYWFCSHEHHKTNMTNRYWMDFNLYISPVKNPCKLVNVHVTGK